MPEVPQRDLNPGGTAWVIRLFAACTALAALATAGACSATKGWFESPREEMVRTVNEKCDVINERIAEDLAYGTTIDADDTEKMRERVMLVKDLKNHVRSLPAPESATDRANLKAWLGHLDEYTEELDTLRSSFEGGYQPGTDMLLILTAGIVEENAKQAASRAERLGFDSCAHADKWEYIEPN